VRALALVRGLPEHSLIDRLVRGRAWIPVLGVLLAGIVAMQVEILKLGTTMGRAMERSSALQTQNESLQANVARLADDQRIERLAAATGMTMPTADSLGFLSARRGALGRAIANIHPPDSAGFASQLAAQAAAAAALMPSSQVADPATSGGTTSTAGTASGSTASSTPSSSSSTTSPTTTSSTSSTTSAAGVASPASTPSGANGAAGIGPVVATQSGATGG
jgi:cell division protein FtsL